MKIDTVKTVWAESELKQNTYVVTIGDSCVIIDAGASLDDIMPLTEGRKVEAILVTHAHYDHITYIESYQIAFDCPIYMHEQGEKFLTSTHFNVSKYFGVDKTFDLHDVKYIKGKETLNLAGIQVRAIFTPGHSDDSLCYLFEIPNESNELDNQYNCSNNENINQNNAKTNNILDRNQNGEKNINKTNNILFTGDTFFSIAVGRTDLPTGNAKRLIASLNQLIKMDFNTAYTGHGRLTTKQEQLTNIPRWIQILKRDLLSGDKKVNY